MNLPAAARRGRAAGLRRRPAARRGRAADLRRRPAARRGRAAATSTGRRPGLGLLRVLGVWEGAAVGIGVAIGAGIFRLPGYVAGYLDEGWKILCVWAVGWLLVLGDSLVLSELATRTPRAGGWYVYIEKGYGRFPAFVYGWAYTLVVDPASSAALVVILGEYLGSLFGWPPLAGRLAGISVTLGLFGLQMAGIRLGSRVQDALTYTKLLMLLAVALMAFFLRPAAALVSAAHPAATAGGLVAFALALQGVLWTFEGYANATTLTEESVDPARTLPRALVLGALALGATYLIVNGAYLHVLGRAGLAASRLPAADVAAQAFGGAGERLFLALAVFVALGSLNGAALSAPRVTYALSRSGLAPRLFTRVNPRGTPDMATLWFAAAWTFYALLGTAESLVAVSIFVGALANVAVTATLFRERGRDAAPAPGGIPGQSHAPGGTPVAAIFRSPFFPFLPAILVVVWAVFAGVALYSQGWKVGYGLGVTALAVPAYVLWTRRERGAPGTKG